MASRLRRARAQIRQHLRAIELAWDLGTTTAQRIETPAFLRREKSSPFWCALLETGIFTPASSAMRMKTLTALGLRRSLKRAAPGREAIRDLLARAPVARPLRPREGTSR